MAEYGIEVRSETDNSLIIDSNGLNQVFIGKATLWETITPTYSGSIFQTGGLNPPWWEFKMQTPDCTVRPAFFFTAPNHTNVVNIQPRGAGWSIIFKVHDVQTPPEVYCFLESTAVPAAIGTHGFQIYKPGNVLTFDSRWDRKLLVIERLISLTEADNVDVAFASVAKPAILHNTKYQQTTQSPTFNYTLYLSKRMIKLTTTNLNMFMEQYWRIYYRLGIPNGYVGTWGDSGALKIPMINGADYD